MLRDTIKSETITAMKAGDKLRVAALRLISAKVKDQDIAQRGEPVRGQKSLTTTRW